MLFDLSDPLGTLQLIVSAVILIELIKGLEAGFEWEYVQKRIAFYTGILGGIWGFLKGAVEGFGIIGQRLFSRIEKDLEEDHKHDPNWTKKEYFEHIRVKHPDIWEQFLEDGEGKIWENYKDEGGTEG